MIIFSIFLNESIKVQVCKTPLTSFKSTKQTQNNNVQHDRVHIFTHIYLILIFLKSHKYLDHSEGYSKFTTITAISEHCPPDTTEDGEALVFIIYSKVAENNLMLSLQRNRKSTLSLYFLI